MPKFMYSVYGLVALGWAAVLCVVFLMQPNTYISIFLFLLFIFLALGFTFSLPAYYLYKKSHPTFTDQRNLFRKGLKWGFFLSFGAAGVMFLKAFDLVNLLNTGLFVLFYIILSFQLRGR